MILPCVIIKEALPMHVMTRDEVFTLTEHAGVLSISLYMANPVPQDPKKSQIRFKSLLKEVESRLEDSPLRPQQKEGIIEPARALLSDSMFWERQSAGLAVFLAPGFSRIYRLPMSVTDMVMVSEHFHIKPLLSLLSGDEEFYILGLSQKQIRLFHCTRDSVRELEPEGVPESISEALQYEPLEKQGQFGGGTSGQFHGHGAGDEDFKDNIFRFFRKVDSGLREILKGGSPLVLAGVSYICSIYREANTYQGLVEEAIEGSPENASPRDLHKKAWEIVEPIFNKTQQEAREKFGNLQGTGKASNQLEEVVPAAASGRVDTLFVALGRQIMGRFDESSNTVETDGETAERDLLDLAASRTLQNGGTVYAVGVEDVPGDGDVAAIFRY
jgi:hypothetical protein